jgi:hypothetical protein
MIWDRRARTVYITDARFVVVEQSRRIPRSQGKHSLYSQDNASLTSTVYSKSLTLFLLSECYTVHMWSVPCYRWWYWGAAGEMTGDLGTVFSYTLTLPSQVHTTKLPMVYGTILLEEYCCGVARAKASPCY